MIVRTGIRPLAAALALLAAAGCKPAPAPAPEQASIGAAVAVDPAATIASPPAPGETAAVDAPVFANDVIETGPGGALRVRFVDSTVFSVGANAGATIDRFVYDPGRGASSMSVDFARGAFRFVSGRPLHTDPGQVPVQTPVASIGVRGTTFTGVIGPEAEALWRSIDRSYRSDGGDVSVATLILLGDGAVEVDGSGVKTLLDRPGQALFFRRKGAQPLGPLMVWPVLRGRIEDLGSPPSLGPDSGATPTPTPSPSARPSPAPSASPSARPTPQASKTPDVRPTATPSPRPTTRPPWVRPTATPSSLPTFRPPVTRPTVLPSPRPTYRPPVTRPTAPPSPRPTFRPPVTRPTATPTPRPTFRPPVTRPTAAPTFRPTPKGTPSPRPTFRTPLNPGTPRPTPSPQPPR